MLGEDVTHLRDHFDPSAPDEEWIPWVGLRGWVVVTKDDRITRKPGQVKALRDAGAAAFVFVQKVDPNLWGWVEVFVRRWPEFKAITRSRKPPFVARVPQRGRISFS